MKTGVPDAFWVKDTSIIKLEMWHWLSEDNQVMSDKNSNITGKPN